MKNERSRLLVFKIGATGILSGLIVSIGGSTIEDMGELVHFNCRQDQCELTRESLIGGLQTSYFSKSELVGTSIQSKSNLVGRSSSRLILVTRSQMQVPLTTNWSRSGNNQLLVQRDQIDQFLKRPQADRLSVRTHRPGQLWAILGGLGIFGGIVGTKLWSSKSIER